MTDELPGDSSDAPTVEAPVAATTDAAEASGRRGVFVPAWAALVLAGVIIFGSGVAAGHYLTRDEGDRDHHDGISMHDIRGWVGRVLPRDGGRAPTAPRVRPDAPGRVRPAPGPARVFLGVSVRDSSTPRGATLVRVVPSSPAAAGGLKAGDVITAIDDESVTDAAALTTVVHAHKAGDQLTITYTRDGATKTAKVTLVRDMPLPQQ